MKSSNKNFILCTEGERSPVYAIAILNEKWIRCIKLLLQKFAEV